MTTSEMQSGWVPLDKYERSEILPTCLWFAGGLASDRSIKYWHELVEHAVKLLWNDGKLTLENAELHTGGSDRFIINTTLEQAHDFWANTYRRFNTPQQVSGTPIYYERNISGQTAVNNTKRLLEHCGLNLSDVYVFVPRVI